MCIAKLTYVIFVVVIIIRGRGTEMGMAYCCATFGYVNT